MVSCKKDTSLIDSTINTTGNNANIATMATSAQDNSQIALLPTSGIQDKYYIVAKVSNRAITVVTEGSQLQQTELCFDTAGPSDKADLSICYFGKKNNPENLKPGTYTIYKIQWGSLVPYTLFNHFWDVYNSSKEEGAPVISWPSRDQDNQLFVFESTGDTDNSVYIRSLSSGKYLQIAGYDNTVAGAKLEQRSYSGDINQKFFIRKRTAN